MKYKSDEIKTRLSKLLKESVHNDLTWVHDCDAADAPEIAKLAASLLPHFKTTEESIFKAAELLISTRQIISMITDIAYNSCTNCNDQPYTLSMYMGDKNFRSYRPVYHRILKTFPKQKAEMLIKKLRLGESVLSREIRDKMERNLALNMSLRRGKKSKSQLFKKKIRAESAF